MDGAERAMAPKTRADAPVGSGGAFAEQAARLAAALVALEGRLADEGGAGALAAARAEAADRAAECARLRSSNEALRAICAEMREGGGDLDAAITAELEAVAAQRAAERAEMDRLIRALDALVQDAA